MDYNLVKSRHYIEFHINLAKLSATRKAQFSYKISHEIRETTNTL